MSYAGRRTPPQYNNVHPIESDFCTNNYFIAIISFVQEKIWFKEYNCTIGPKILQQIRVGSKLHKFNESNEIKLKMSCLHSCDLFNFHHPLDTLLCTNYYTIYEIMIFNLLLVHAWIQVKSNDLQIETYLLS